MPYKDKQKQKEYQQTHYQRNKLDYHKRFKLVRHRNQEAIKNIKAIKVCADCKKSYPPYVMDFDHIRGEKLFEISTAARQGRNLDLILQEIEKCELVCANCHRIRTHKNKYMPD